MEKIGRHTINCQTINEVNFNTLLEGRKVNILYSDPPWGDGNLKFWATMNKKQTGNEVKPIKYDELINIYCDIIKNHVNGYCFIETGLRWKDQTIEKLKPYLYNIETHELLYKSGNRYLPNIMITGTTSPELPKFSGDIKNKSGYEILKRCIGNVAKPGQIILDPCCGKGYCAKAAMEFDLIFIGNELNSKRLEETKQKLVKQ